MRTLKVSILYWQWSNQRQAKGEVGVMLVKQKYFFVIKQLKPSSHKKYKHLPFSSRTQLFSIFRLAINQIMVHLVRPDHAKAVNLARRLSVQNEADLLQEPYYGKFAICAMDSTRKRYLFKPRSRRFRHVSVRCDASQS